MTNPRPKPPTTYAISLGARLRAVRQRRGLTLHQVHGKSRGVWKQSVIGSYERGGRAISAERLVALCAWYEVDPAEVLTGELLRAQGRRRVA